MQTVREGLDENRINLKDKVVTLFLCKKELFYITSEKKYDDSVYPVAKKTAEEEAEFFGVELQEV